MIKRCYAHNFKIEAKNLLSRAADCKWFISGKKIFPGAQPSQIPPLKSEMIEALSIMMEALAGGHHAEKEMPWIV